jgi:secondary thiamine-phosphate synthase enzyme
LWDAAKAGDGLVKRARHGDMGRKGPAGRIQAMAEMVQASHTLQVATRGKGFVEITGELARWLKSVAAEDGLLTVFVSHTSASLTIQENADPSVLDDLMTALARLAPENAGWTHDTEGPDDMPAHVKTMLTAVSLQIPVLSGKLALGTWQAIYLIEHRARPHRREIVLQFIGSTA